jgi:hypothetical protein
MVQSNTLATQIEHNVPDQQRSCLRVHLTLPAEVVDYHGGHHTALVRDISTSGVFLYADFAPRVNSEIAVDFLFPVSENRMKITCAGKVVRVENSSNGGATGIAMQFLHHDVAVIH